MLTLITGLPGSSKTLNALKFINEDSLYQGRPIFYYNIEELKLPWHELSLEEAKEWYELPINSVIVLDECQSLFRPQKFGVQIPRAITEFETHRHKGFDAFLLTQHPKLVDVNLRRLVGQHFHFERAYGFKMARKLVWQKCVDDPSDYHDRKEAEVSKVRLDKKYFGLYKSTEVDTHKARVPKKLVFVLGLVVLLIFGLFQFLSSFGDRAKEMDSEPVDGSQPAGMVVQNSNSSGSALPTDPVEYAKLYEPRITGLDYTAPIYDRLTEPKTFPKPSCIMSELSGRCSCYSQQGTRMAVPQDMCVNIIKYGWFDFTKEDKPTAPVNKRSHESVTVASLPRSGLVAVAEYDSDRSIDYDSRVSRVLRERAERRGR